MSPTHSSILTLPPSMLRALRTGVLTLSVAIAVLRASDGTQGNNGSLAQNAPPPPTNTRHSGPPRRQVPATVWQRDFTRPIDGTLPANISSALNTVVDELATRAPAVSVAVAIPGLGRWTHTQGVARTEPRTPLPADAMFQVASTTKTFTSVAVLQLARENKLQLSQTVERWFAEVPTATNITINQLLRHTSGLPSFNALPSWTLDYKTPRESISMAAAEPTLFPPGTDFAYSNTGFAMLGIIIEDLEGRPLHETLKARFGDPLGLGHTSLRYPKDRVQTVSGHIDGKPIDVPDDYATPFSAGGLASTAEDLVTFWHALLSGQLLPTQTAHDMFTNLAPMGENSQMFYGQGVQLYDIPQGPGLMLGHSGGVTGFTSVVAYVATDDIYVSVIFNDQKTPAEAGLWAVVRALRAAR